MIDHTHETKLCDKFKMHRTKMEVSCCEFNLVSCLKTHIFHHSRFTVKTLLEPYIWCKMRLMIYHRSIYSKTASDEGKTWLVFKMCLMFPIRVQYVCEMFAIHLSQTSHKHLTNISATFRSQLPY